MMLTQSRVKRGKTGKTGAALLAKYDRQTDRPADARTDGLTGKFHFK